ncbi:ankyrin repeat and BTB/POZ domain-containing protein 1 isoform 1-T1 [Morphnus guianensis]
MDTSDLFTSCKKGDVSRVRYLLEQRDVEINVRDKWDSTPLYYACLCGHEELVRYLLANGAKCEANTFDGERCLYGALSDAIRRLLKEYKQITAKCMKRDYYDVFLQRLLEQGYQSDIVFIVHGKSFCAHRCILSARSAYFAEMFETKWKGKNMIVLKHPLINPAAFGSLLQYLYTGMLSAELFQARRWCQKTALPSRFSFPSLVFSEMFLATFSVTVKDSGMTACEPEVFSYPKPGRLDIDVEYVNDCKRLAKQCRLQDLIDDLETKCKKVYEFVSSKPGTCVKVLTIEPTGNCRLQEDLALLADCALPAELRVGFGELPFDSTDNFNSCPDVCFRVADYNFLCHKAFFCGRSDYFKALLEDHFSESEELQTQPSIPVVTLHNISEDIFSRVLYYIYSDDTELSPENAYDVLCVADMYLLPGLKRLCGRTLAQILDEDNVVSIWRIAKLFQLTRLEDQCTEYMAKIIEKLVELEEFVAAVKENAEAVEERQETDSIPLVDDIRFHITSNVQTYSAIEEANQKLEALENLLASIGLEC